MSIGESIKRLRMKKGIKKCELADKIGVQFVNLIALKELLLATQLVEITKLKGIKED